MKKFVEFVVKVVASMATVYMAATIYDYLINGYWYWAGVRELIPVYGVIVGAAYVGFHLDGIVGTIIGLFNKKEVKPQFVVMKGGDIEGR